MPPDVSIRPYQRDDERAVIDVWNRSMWCDPITVETWRYRVLLDPNFDPNLCLVAERGGTVVGFVYAVTRQVPFFNEGKDPATAWISAIGVDPAAQRQGIGSALVERLESELRDLGRTRILIDSYVPNYFIPGVDVGSYAAAVEFLKTRGFRERGRPLSMRAILTGYRIPAALSGAYDRMEAAGITVRPARPDDIVPVLQFTRDHFSWDWHREATGVFLDLFAGFGDPRQVGLLVAEKEGEILGYAQHRSERFGPFGVRQDRRSQGIGRVLLAEMLMSMRAQNFHTAWFLSTGDDAARLYATCGFEEVRRFVTMTRDLAD